MAVRPATPTLAASATETIPTLLLRSKFTEYLLRCSLLWERAGTTARLSPDRDRCYGRACERGMNKGCIYINSALTGCFASTAALARTFPHGIARAGSTQLTER